VNEKKLDSKVEMNEEEAEALSQEQKSKERNEEQEADEGEDEQPEHDENEEEDDGPRKMKGKVNYGILHQCADLNWYTGIRERYSIPRYC